MGYLMERRDKMDLSVGLDIMDPDDVAIGFERVGACAGDIWKEYYCPLGIELTGKGIHFPNPNESLPVNGMLYVCAGCEKVVVYDGERAA